MYEHTYIYSVRNEEKVSDGQMSSHHYLGRENFRSAWTYVFLEKYTCATVDVPQ